LKNIILAFYYMQLVQKEFSMTKSLSIRKSIILNIIMTILILLLGSACEGASTQGGVPSSSQTLQATTSTVISAKRVALQDIHMFNVATGWAMTSDPTHILHTTAGITHWQDVSFVLDSSTSLITCVNFFSASKAWVIEIDGKNSWLYLTNDGGHSWQKALIPEQVMGRCHITFLNAQMGWLLDLMGAGGGSEALDILRTSDGGLTWKVVSVTSFEGKSSTALPFQGNKSGLGFVNTSTGWATGFTAAPNFVWLYVTHDGGLSWQHQNIPIAGNIHDAQTSTEPPVFFSATDGILPVIFSALSNPVTIVYVTHNGGQSWTATDPAPQSQFIQFVDETHGWTAMNSNAAGSNQYTASTFYRTSDGGQHWNHYMVRFGAEITLLDMVSSTQGWAIDSNQALYQSTDGGLSWAKVTPVVS
jgi:photosystem II stability/assembly factor-like uncharacterized protein